VSMTTESSRVPQVAREDVTDPELLAVVERAEQLSTPKPAWYLTLAHDPEVAVAYARFWDLTHRGGRVEHTTKELMRIAISQLLGCDFCANQRSVTALKDGLQEEEARSCAMPDFNHPDPRVRAALRYARALALDRPADDGSAFDGVYEDLRESSQTARWWSWAASRPSRSGASSCRAACASILDPVARPNESRPMTNFEHANALTARRNP
jgi:AhpD family alkylhydroperoxidase